MSLYDYRASADLSAQDVPFYALIMAAMRKADTINVIHLKFAWPAVWEELEARYHAPGGLLPGEGTIPPAAPPEAIEYPSTEQPDWLVFAERIDDLLASGEYDWAEDTLGGIMETVTRTHEVTSRQAIAVDNIEEGRRTHD